MFFNGVNKRIPAILRPTSSPLPGKKGGILALVGAILLASQGVLSAQTTSEEEEDPDVQIAQSDADQAQSEVDALEGDPDQTDELAQAQARLDLARGQLTWLRASSGGTGRGRGKPPLDKKLVTQLSQSRKHVHAAHAALRMGKDDVAVQELNKAVELAPKGSPILTKAQGLLPQIPALRHLRAAEAALQADHDDVAIRQWKEAAEVAPKNSPVHTLALAAVAQVPAAQFMRAAEEALRTGKDDVAVKLLKQAAETVPKGSQLQKMALKTAQQIPAMQLLRKADEAYQEGRSGDALRLLREAAGRAPKHSPAQVAALTAAATIHVAQVSQPKEKPDQPRERLFSQQQQSEMVSSWHHGFQGGHDGHQAVHGKRTRPRHK